MTIKAYGVLNILTVFSYLTNVYEEINPKTALQNLKAYKI